MRMPPQNVKHGNTARTAVQTASLVVLGNNRCLCDHILPWWLTHELQWWKHNQPTPSFSSFITEVGKDGGQRIDIVSVEVNELRLFEPDLHSFRLRCGWFCKRWRDDPFCVRHCDYLLTSNESSFIIHSYTRRHWPLLFTSPYKDDNTNMTHSLA